MPSAFQSNAFQTNAFQIDATVAQPARGTAPWLFGTTQRRTEEDVRRSRERFGIPQGVAEAIEDIAARQQEETDAAALRAELRRELKLRRIAYRTKYLEALAERTAAFITELEQQRQMAQLRERQNAVILMLIAAAAAA